METEHKIRNNNQNPDIQTNQVSSSQVLQRGECSTSGVYLCMPRIHAVYSMKAVSHPKDKQKGKSNSTTHSHSRTGNGIVYENNIEEPMDLTCAEKRHNESSTSDDNVLLVSNMSKSRVDDKPELSAIGCDYQQNNFIENGMSKRGKRRKHNFRNSHYDVPVLESGILRNLDDSDRLQSMNTSNDGRQAEVLKAAKSLFSKRTRTLFHWIYPNAPKAQLTAAVESSWETLGEQEKEFYISQVLGRFGFPQTNLMVNPQLGGLSAILPLPPLDLSTSNQEGNEETSNAVSGLLMSEIGSSQLWMHASNSSTSCTPSGSRLPYTSRIGKKRGRLGRPPGSRNRKQIKEEFPVLEQIREEPNADEFQDDPELSREFQQFRWTLHLNDNKA